MKRFVRFGFAGVTAVTLTALALSAPSTTGAPKIQNKVLAHALDVELGRVQANLHMARLSSGVMYPLLQATGVLNRRIAQGDGSLKLGNGSLGTVGCSKTRNGFVTNVRVNQDCSLRRQAEETIVVNPLNRSNLIAGQNDSRVGFNHCGYDFSFDGGNTWGDALPPFFQYVQGDNHTADACSDPTAAFDSKGNAYAGGIVFDIASNANSILVMKSNAGLGGSFFHDPGKGAFQEYSDANPGVVASDNDETTFNDKELMTADSNPKSPKADNVYMTWTRFRQGDVGADSPIYFSQSTDGGATWSKGVEISGSNAQFCTVGSGENDKNACDQDQGSHPIVGKDGTIYVAFGNGNVPGAGMVQHLIVECPPGADCSKSASWAGPYKIGDDFATQPVGPDSNTGCPGGRQCLPPNGYRMDDFVEGSISIDDHGVLYGAWGDYRNGMNSKNCPGLSPAADAKPPCNNDVFYSFSTDGGKTWAPAILVTSPDVFGQSAQWQPWSAVSPNGGNLWIAFYDRSYNCEQKGCNDITLARVRDPSTHPTFSYQRLTTDSMPNLVPKNNPVQAGFLGDYMWVTAPHNAPPYVVWADTRGRGGTVEEDIYFAR